MASDHLLPSERTSGHSPLTAGEYSDPSHPCHHSCHHSCHHLCCIERPTGSRPVLEPNLNPCRSQASFVAQALATRTLMRPAACAQAALRVRTYGRIAEISTTFLGRAGACSRAREIRHSPDEIAEPNRGERRSLSVRWRTVRKLGTAGRAASETSDEILRRNLPTGTHLLLSLAQRRPPCFKLGRRCAF